MITITDSEKTWFERAKSAYGPMTCPECYGEIKKQMNAYHCDNCSAYFDADQIGELHATYKTLAKRYVAPANAQQKKYVVYAEGTWRDYNALFKKAAGPAAYGSEADADKFSYEQAQKLIQHKGRNKWIMKQVG